MGAARDPRLTPARPDLAAESLRGLVEAAAWAAPRPMVAAAPMVPVTGTPDGEAPMTTQLILGEGFTVYDLRDGWAWGQCDADGYVGYAPEAGLAPMRDSPSHRVRALTAVIYARPDLRSRPVGAVPFAARVTAEPAEQGFHALALGGFIPTPHLAPAGSVEADWVATAERFLGAPYLWGGRTAAGLDCSGLVQVARQASGLPCPRDSDMQAAEGADLPPDAELRRGDLVFWRGHVGIMATPTHLLHANAHAMAVTLEALDAMAARVLAGGGGPVTARRRPAEA
jgi:cell wall-associated NlpC family hydrolase